MTTLRKKLAAAMGEAAVNIHVPNADPDAELIKGAEAVTSTVQALVDERNTLKQRSEWLACQLEIAQQSLSHRTEEYNRSVVRLHDEYDRTLRTIGMERDHWRGMLLVMVAANGDLTATVNGMLSLAQNARNTLHQVEQLVARLPVKDEPQPEDLDASTPAPEPTMEEIDRLRNTLVNLANVSKGDGHEA